jgi:hypothetical protein
MIEELLARISYLELGLAALKYYVINGETHDGLRIVDDLAQTLLDLNEDLENSVSHTQ